LHIVPNQPFTLDFCQGVNYWSRNEPAGPADRPLTWRLVITLLAALRHPAATISLENERIFVETLQSDRKIPRGRANVSIDR